MLIAFWIVLGIGFLIAFVAAYGAVDVAETNDPPSTCRPEPRPTHTVIYRNDCDDRRRNEEHRAELESYWW